MGCKSESFIVDSTVLLGHSLIYALQVDITKGLLPVNKEERKTKARPAHGMLKWMQFLFCFAPKKKILIYFKFSMLCIKALALIALDFYSLIRHAAT